MPWEHDSVCLLAASSHQRENHHGEGERNAALRVEHLVEVAVAHVVVVLVVAAKAKLEKEVVAHRPRRRDRISAESRESRSEWLGESVEDVEVVGDVEARIRVFGDEERAFFDRRRRKANEPRER